MTCCRSLEVLPPAVAFVLLTSCIACGDRESEPDSEGAVTVLPTRLAEWTLQDSTVSYDRETIFDYINGAGEVYRSYAFNEVVVARYSRAGESDILVELFDMGVPEDAYGVFSYAREHEEEGIGSGYEHKGDVLCFWQNRFYACLAFDDPARALETSLVEVATALSRALPTSSVRPLVVGMLPPDGLVPFSERFFHLHQSLNYHYYLARENLLNLGADTDVVLGRYQPGSTFLVIARYESDGDATAALVSFRSGYLPDAGEARVYMTENGKFVACDHTGRYVVVVLDADSEQSANELLRGATERVPATTN